MLCTDVFSYSGSWHYEWYVECYVLMCFHILEVDTMNGMWNDMYSCVFIFWKLTLWMVCGMLCTHVSSYSGSWHYEWYVECYVLMCFHILEVDTMNGMWNAMYWCVFICWKLTLWMVCGMLCTHVFSYSGSWHYEWYVECYVLMCFHILLLWFKFNVHPSIFDTLFSIMKQCRIRIGSEKDLKYLFLEFTVWGIVWGMLIDLMSGRKRLRKQKKLKLLETEIDSLQKTLKFTFGGMFQRWYNDDKMRVKHPDVTKMPLFAALIPPATGEVERHGWR